MYIQKKIRDVLEHAILFSSGIILDVNCILFFIQGSSFIESCDDHSLSHSRELRVRV